MEKKIFLNDWQFSLQSKLKNIDTIKYNTWYKAFVPGTIYHNLINQKLIPDPFYADNELKLQWVAESDWSYKTTFLIPKEFNNENRVYLIFEGLDTVAEIYLNGEKLGSTENMFIKYEFEISRWISKKNNLELKFTSPYKYAKNLEEKFGRLPVALNSERVYIRKAQYSFGWDWGPSFADIGIWKPVYLVQREEHCINDFTFKTINFNESIAANEIWIRFNKELSAENKIIVTISDEMEIAEYQVQHNNKNEVKEIIEIGNPKLWWPNGEGEPHLYDLKINLYRNNLLQDVLTKKIGLRKIELQLKENEDNTFRFIVNGRKIFAKGANWIPTDSFLTRVDEDKYRSLLTLAKEANMNFIRVWGGGIYEQDKFYEICDQLGLLVWQDFMFACASYPEFSEFLDNIRDEIKQNVLRLQYHPSVAIWCGNNENEWIWYQNQILAYKKMPGYKIYHQIIPDILKEIDHQANYWPSTPFVSPGHQENEDPNSELSGNRHQWDLWAHWKDYSEVSNDSSLFVTEFGFQSPANQSTLEKVIPEEHRKPQSYLFEFHNKQVEGNERQFKFLAGHLPVKTTWRDFIYLAQLSQGLALKTCIEQWRFNYPHTNGSIIWQLNDCWPVSSWALIDSDIKPKLSYYLVKQSFNNQILKFMQIENENQLYVLNSGGLFKGYFILSQIDLSKGTSYLVKKRKIMTDNIKEMIYSHPISQAFRSGTSVLSAALYNDQNELIYETVYAFREWKYLKLPKAKIKAKLVKIENNQFILLTSDKPAFFVTVYNDLLNRNVVTLLPGNKVLLPLKISNAKKTDIKIFALNKYLD